MAIDNGNLFAGIPDTLPDEQIDALLSTPHVRIERIVSRGHSSPPGFWYDQDKPEWVIVLAGAAGVLFDRILEAAGAPSLVVSDRGLRYGLLT